MFVQRQIFQQIGEDTQEVFIMKHIIKTLTASGISL